jgi:single-strand DNA-binding protein
MELHTHQSLSGFIASEPQRTVTENHDTRFYARIGQPHFRHEDDGTFTPLEPTFHDLVAYRATAERALAHLAKGDSFIAEGYIHTFQKERNGELIQREEFVATKIGHDLVRTDYEVDRSRRQVQAAEKEALTDQRVRSLRPGPSRVRSTALGF